MPTKQLVKQAREEEEKEEYVYDEITGARGKKRALDTLNKSKLGKHEMDELFCQWE